ncbi:hypothetical protein TNCV_230331 [Trichonephila clavipes]|nr:hypothetical protein TNCV_230331 [Trichonephila clavipes]
MSLDTERETHHFIEVSTQLMANAKFELRGWEFTDSNVSTPQPEISSLGNSVESSESESQVSVQLVFEKSRIAPLKAMSIPKLELMACTIGVRLTDMVKMALSIKDIEGYY